MLNHNADPNIADSDGNTALMALCLVSQNSNTGQIIETLIKNGANIAHKNNYGETVLDMALTLERDDIVCKLLEINLNQAVDAVSQQALPLLLNLACKKNDIKVVTPIIEKLSSRNLGPQSSLWAFVETLDDPNNKKDILLAVLIRYKNERTEDMRPHRSRAHWFGLGFSREEKRVAVDALIHNLSGDDPVGLSAYEAVLKDGRLAHLYKMCQQHVPELLPSHKNIEDSAAPSDGPSSSDNTPSSRKMNN